MTLQSGADTQDGTSAPRLSLQGAGRYNAVPEPCLRGGSGSCDCHGRRRCGDQQSLDLAREAVIGQLVIKLA